MVAEPCSLRAAVTFASTLSLACALAMRGARLLLRAVLARCMFLATIVGLMPIAAVVAFITGMPVMNFPAIVATTRWPFVPAKALIAFVAEALSRRRLLALADPRLVATR